MNTISITYSSFAVVPEGVRIGRIYEYGKDSKGTYIKDIHGNQYMDDSLIKSLFSPVDGTWEESKLKKTTTDKE